MTATLDPASALPNLVAFFAEARALIDAELEHRLSPDPIDAMERGETVLIDGFGNDPGRLAEAMHYAGTGPGKRLRPIITLAAAEACGGTREAALPAAIAIELLHAYTLVHDDLPAMDNDVERRGRPTVHVEFGEAIAILAGDGLLTAAFGALAELGPRAAAAITVLAQRAGVVGGVLRGQAIDLTRPAGDANIDHLHRLKTGSLFAAAAELGAIAAGAPSTTREALAEYGLAIGIAFQHADDRDDAEPIVGADDRMRTLCAEARTLVGPLGPAAKLLDEIAAWIGSRA